MRGRTGSAINGALVFVDETPVFVDDSFSEHSPQSSWTTRSPTIPPAFVDDSPALPLRRSPPNKELVRRTWFETTGS